MDDATAEAHSDPDGPLEAILRFRDALEKGDIDSAFEMLGDPVKMQLVHSSGSTAGAPGALGELAPQIIEALEDTETVAPEPMGVGLELLLFVKDRTDVGDGIEQAAVSPFLMRYDADRWVIEGIGERSRVMESHYVARPPTDAS